jgi:aspartyl/asparaginyl-tRNA synthetase
MITTFITDFPASIKPFYARVNDDGQTVGLVNDCMIKENDNSQRQRKMEAAY